MSDALKNAPISESNEQSTVSQTVNVIVLAVHYPNSIIPTIEYYDVSKLTTAQIEVIAEVHNSNSFNEHNLTDINEAFRVKFDIDDDECWNDVINDALIMNIKDKLCKIKGSYSVVLL